MLQSMGLQRARYDLATLQSKAPGLTLPENSTPKYKTVLSATGDVWCHLRINMAGRIPGTSPKPALPPAFLSQ